MFGGNFDYYNFYVWCGNFLIVEEVVEEGILIFFNIVCVWVFRFWGGIMDMLMDGLLFID